MVNLVVHLHVVVGVARARVRVVARARVCGVARARVHGAARRRHQDGMQV